VDTHDRGFRSASRRRPRGAKAAVGTAFARAGVDALTLSTDDDLVAAIGPDGGAPAPAAEVTMSFIWPPALPALLLIPLGLLLDRASSGAGGSAGGCRAGPD